jgi:hypothetical protein
MSLMNENAMMPLSFLFCHVLMVLWLSCYVLAKLTFIIILNVIDVNLESDFE